MIWPSNLFFILRDPVLKTNIEIIKTNILAHCDLFKNKTFRMLTKIVWRWTVQAKVLPHVTSFQTWPTKKIHKKNNLCNFYYDQVKMLPLECTQCFFCCCFFLICDMVMSLDNHFEQFYADHIKNVASNVFTTFSQIWPWDIVAVVFLSHVI